MMISIYLVCSEISGQKLHKIGFTRRTPEKRIKEFKTGNASEIYLVDSFESRWGTKIEAMLHRIYKPKKINGEWFDLSEEDVKMFKKHCTSIHNNLKLISEQNTYFLDKGDF
jgi:hypothetical protein